MASIVGTMSDGPSDGGRTARSDAATRLADLLADVVEQDAAPPPAPAEDAPARPAGRRIVRRRPAADEAPGPSDGDGDDAVGGAAPAEDPDATQPVPVLVGTGPDEPKVAERPVAPERSVAPEVDGEPEPEDEAEDDDEAQAEDDDEAPGPAPEDGGRPPVRVPRFTLRAVAFGVAFVLLVAAVPTLGWAGVQRIRSSRGGDVQENATQDPEAPNYTQIVNPTATAMVVHRDAFGTPVSATVLALRPGDDGGGTVLLVPTDLGLIEQDFFDRVIDRWMVTQDDDAFRHDIEDVLGVMVPPPLVDVTDESLATLVAPVAPLELVVNDPVVADNGITYEGPSSLSAEEVGPFLRASREGELEIARLERARDLWTAWLEAIASNPSGEPIGAAATGIGSFLRVLASGDPVVETLDVELGEPNRVYQPPFYVPGPSMAEQVIDAVPFPLSPRFGRRYDLRLLNGVEAGTPPFALMRDLGLDGASISIVGNGPEFGRRTTLVAYKDDMWADEMEALRDRWGDSIEIEQMSARQAESTNEDVVITLGSDVLDQYEE